MQQQVASITIHSPEGPFRLAAQRAASCAFNPERSTHLTIARLGSDGDYLVFNVMGALHVASLSAVDKEATSIDWKQTSGAALYPTCHSHNPDAPNGDLLVGLSSGEVSLLSLRVQLLSAPGAVPLSAAGMSFNVDGSANATRCVGVAWVAGAAGSAFASAHRDGGICLWQKVPGSSSDAQLLVRTSSQQLSVRQLRPPDGAGGGAGALAASPDGHRVAAAGRDGVLRVYNLESGGLLGGFKSYYGGLLCAAWSPDGAYVATGGEDDLVCLYGLAERAVVAVGEGHASWVAAVAFDEGACRVEEAAAPQSPTHQRAAASEAGGTPPMDRVYRLASAGQDCQLLLWDFTVADQPQLVQVAANALGSNRRPQSSSAPLPPTGGGAFRVVGGQPHVPPQQQQQVQQPPGASGLRRSGSLATGPGDAMWWAAEESMSPLGRGGQGAIAPPLARAEMQLVQPLSHQK